MYFLREELGHFATITWDICPSASAGLALVSVLVLVWTGLSQRETIHLHGDSKVSWIRNVRETLRRGRMSKTSSQQIR